MNTLQIKLSTGEAITIEFVEGTLLTRTGSQPGSKALWQVFQSPSFQLQIRKSLILSAEKSTGLLINLPFKR